MCTRSGKVYYSDKLTIDMDPNSSPSGITSPTDSLIPENFKTLNEIKTQVNTLSQRMNMIEVKRRGRDCNEDCQPNQRREDRVNMNYDLYEDDERYIKNI